MSEDPKEIIKMVDERDKELKDLKDRFESDYKLWRLTPYSGLTGEDYDIYTTSWPRNKSDKIAEILAYAPLKISIPPENDTEKERKDKAAAERLIYGSLNIADERLRATIQPTIQEQLAFYAVNRGWVGLRIYFHTEDEGGDAFPDIAVWDPLNTIWDVGSRGTQWVCHKRPITKSQAKEEYGLDVKEGETSVIYDFWDNESYKIIFKNDTLVNEKHGLDHPPVFIGMVGPSPFIQSGELKDTIKDVGESIFAPDRNLIPVMNKLKTFYMTIIGQGTHTPIMIYSSDGKKELEKSPFRKGADIKLSTDKKETIEPLFKPTVPQDAAAMVSLIQQEFTMGGAISLLWGIDESGGSGYRANLLTHAASTVLLPRQKLIENALEWGAREILSQYKTGEFGGRKFRGKDDKGERFEAELSSDDIKGDWFPEATLAPQLPDDDAAKFAMYVKGIEAGIFSRETAMEELGVPDTEAEKGRIWREKADSVPSVQIRKIMKKLTDDGRADIARQVWEEYQRSLAPKQGSGESPNMPSNVLPPAEYEMNHLTPDQQQRQRETLKLNMLGLERGK